MKSLGIALAALNRRSDDIAANASQARERADAADKAVTDLRASVQDVAQECACRNFAGRTRRLAKAHRRARAIRQGRARRDRQGVVGRHRRAAGLERGGAARRGRARRAVRRRARAGQVARRRRQGAWRRSSRSRRPACRATQRWRTSCARCCRPCCKLRRAGAATAASSTGCRPMPASSCASARSTRRPATIRPRCWRASRVDAAQGRHRGRARRSRQARRRHARAGAGLDRQGARRARPRSRPRVSSPPTRARALGPR